LGGVDKTLDKIKRKTIAIASGSGGRATDTPRLAGSKGDASIRPAAKASAAKASASKVAAAKVAVAKGPAAKGPAAKGSATKGSTARTAAAPASVVKSRAVKGPKSSPSALPTLAADTPVVKSGAGRRVGRSGLADKPPAERGRGGPAWSNVVVSRDEQFRLKRNALLREAARAFSGRGYHNTSLDDVAAVLGVTKAALYHYVRSKQEILFECHMMSLDLGDEALEYARRHGRTGLEQTTLLARRYIELITGEMGRFAVLSEYDALDSGSRAVVGRRRDQFELALREMVARGGTDGSIRGVDPKLAVFYFMGAVNWMTRWFRPDGELSGVDIAAGFSDLLVESLRSRG